VVGCGGRGREREREGHRGWISLSLSLSPLILLKSRIFSEFRPVLTSYCVCYAYRLHNQQLLYHRSQCGARRLILSEALCLSLLPDIHTIPYHHIHIDISYLRPRPYTHARMHAWPRGASEDGHARKPGSTTGSGSRTRGNGSAYKIDWRSGRDVSSSLAINACFLGVCYCPGQVWCGLPSRRSLRARGQAAFSSCLDDRRTLPILYLHTYSLGGLVLCRRPSTRSTTDEQSRQCQR
jgi:hypothetical protein